MSNLNTRGTKTKLESIQIRCDSTKWISRRPHEDRKKSQLSGAPLISAAILSSSQGRAAETGCVLQGYDRPSHKGRPGGLYVFIQDTGKRSERWFSAKAQGRAHFPRTIAPHLLSRPAPSLHSGIISGANRCLLSHLSTVSWMYGQE